MSFKQLNKPFRQLIIPVAAMALLAGCKPSDPAAGPPAHPLLAGEWGSVRSSKGCDREKVVFHRDNIFLKRGGRTTPVFTIRRLAASGGAIDLDLVVSERVVPAPEARSARTQQMMNTEIYITLTVSGDSITLRDAQMRDPNRGRYVAPPADRRKLEEMFSFRKCPDGTS